MSGFNTITPLFTNKRDIIIRHLIILVLALFFGSQKVTSGEFALFSEEWCRISLFTFLMIGTIWNGNILLIDILDRNIPWHHPIQAKLLFTLSIAIFWPILVHNAFNILIYPIVFGKPCSLTSKENIEYLIMTVSITLLINAVFTAIAFFKFWRQSLKETEALKRESITAEFETLKSQINPHFLFNALNTLTSLIEEHPKQATEFVQKLSSVYRYVLTQKDKQLVPLKEELDFIESYIFLNKIRFGANLVTHIDIDPKYHDKNIVSLSMQMLIENCIKHNIISAQKPLHITIGIHQNQLTVTNNLQKKQTVADSSGIGLNNIVHRYSFVSDQEVEITDDGHSFSVSLPLINV